MKKEMKPLKDLNLLDRFLFAAAMEDEVIHQNILEILLNKETHLLNSIQTEKEFRTSPLLRSIRVDVYSMDEEKTIYNTEAQKENKGNVPKRSRYYQALMDSSLLEPGNVNFNLLNNIVLIIIAPFDIFGYGKYQYTFKMKCEEVDGLEMGDGVTRIIFNTRGTNEDEVTAELVELLHYIEDTTIYESDSRKIQEIQQRITQLKSSEEMGVRYMQLWEEKAYEREEALEEGKEEGKIVTEVRLIRRKLMQGMHLSEIAEWMEIDRDYIHKINQLSAENPEWDDERIAYELLQEKNDEV